MPEQKLIKSNGREGDPMYNILFSGNPWTKPNDIDLAFRNLISLLQVKRTEGCVVTPPVMVKAMLLSRWACSRGLRCVSASAVCYGQCLNGRHMASEMGRAPNGRHMASEMGRALEEPAVAGSML